MKKIPPTQLILRFDAIDAIDAIDEPFLKTENLTNNPPQTEILKFGFFQTQSCVFILIGIVDSMFFQLFKTILFEWYKKVKTNSTHSTVVFLFSDKDPECFNKIKLDDYKRIFCLTLGEFSYLEKLELPQNIKSVFLKLNQLWPEKVFRIETEPIWEISNFPSLKRKLWQDLLQFSSFCKSVLED